MLLGSNVGCLLWYCHSNVTLIRAGQCDLIRESHSGSAAVWKTASSLPFQVEVWTWVPAENDFNSLRISKTVVFALEGRIRTDTSIVTEWRGQGLSYALGTSCDRL